MTEYTERLGTAPLGRLLLSLSLPSVASMVTLSLYNIVDTFWLARLGHEAIAALTVFFPYHVLIIAIGSGSGIGIAALVSRRFGEGNAEASNHAAGQIFPITAFFGAIFLLVAIFLSHTVLSIMGATPDIMDYGVQYLTIMGFGAPPLFFLLTSTNLLRGAGDAMRPMIFTITASVLNLALDPLLIFGLGPFPAMGIRGAALATVFSLFVGAGMCLWWITSGRSSYRIALKHLRPDRRVLRDIYRVGAPSMVIQLMESVCFITFNNILSVFGSVALAIAGITIRIADLAFMPILGVSNGLLPIVGFNFGARNWHRMWRAVGLAAAGIAVVMGLATLALELLAPHIIGLFSHDADLLAMAVPAARIFLSSMPIVGVLIIFITTFQGLSKGKEAMLLSLARQVLFFIPALLLLPRFLGITGAWLAVPLSDVLGFLLAGLWILRLRRTLRKSYEWADITGGQQH
ncbi:MAG: MATE family efflux transporter [Dehalococcoidia bacterium]|nr:MATE family efflux transporter [Dehalococcoidia bacterium]